MLTRPSWQRMGMRLCSTTAFLKEGLPFTMTASIHFGCRNISTAASFSGRWMNVKPPSGTPALAAASHQNEASIAVVWSHSGPPRYTQTLPAFIQSATDSIMTVSYTHLRAHETPEHLVCRLLLEKKKNK